MKNLMKKPVEMVLLIAAFVFIPSYYGCQETILGCAADSAYFTINYWNNTNEEVHMMVDDEKFDSSNKVNAGSMRVEKYFLDSCFAHKFKVGVNGNIIYTSIGQDNVWLGGGAVEVNVYWDGTTLTIRHK